MPRAAPMCKIFIGNIVTELTTQEPWIIGQPHNALAPGPAWPHHKMKAIDT